MTIIARITDYRDARNNKPFVFESQVAGEVSNTNLAAGTNYLTSGAVPANKIWVMQNLSYMYVGAVAAVTLNPGYVAAGGYQYFTTVNPPVSGRWYGQLAGDIVLIATNYVCLVVLGATAGDDAYFKWCGYQMDIS